jgi:hypothetical protein
MEISSVMKQELSARRLLFFSVLFIVVSCHGPSDVKRMGESQLERRSEMPNGSHEYPNYSMVENSPELDEPGVAIRLEKGDRNVDFSLEEPIVINGSYCATENIVNKSQGRPIARVFLIVVCRDEPEGWMSPVLDVSNLAPSQPPVQHEEEKIDVEEEDEEESLDFGYFNLDLRKFFELPEAPGKYWVMAALGDYVSERLTFQVVEK